MLSAVLAAAATVSGVVTFERAGLPFCFVRDDSGVNWRVERPAGVELKRGDRIFASGEREMSVKHRLATESLEVRGADPSGAPAPRAVGMEELFRSIMPFGNTSMYGGMFTTEGLLRDINRRQTTTQLLVGEGERNIQVEMPWALEKALPEKLVTGARVRVTGALAYTSIENYEEGVFGRIENVELIPMSGDAVEVVKRAPKPPFFTTRRLIAIFLAALSVLGVMAVWVATLRKMVRRRTRELYESIRMRETAKIEADAARRERLRLAADLHDGFQQYLAGAMFRLQAARNYLPKDAAKSREQLEKAREALQHTQNGLRSTLWAMNEESEGPESLTALFRFAARRMPHWEGKVSMSSEGTERTVARNFCGSLLLVMQEAVANALKHGKAKKVEVKTSFGQDEIKMAITDDGCGFDASSAASAGHYGLATMERRMREIGGTFSISSAPGAGTRIVCALKA